MRIVVKLFAAAAERAGRSAVAVELPPVSTVAALRAELISFVPELAGWLDRCAMAVDCEFAEDSLVLAEVSEVAVIPPVSGG